MGSTPRRWICGTSSPIRFRTLLSIRPTQPSCPFQDSRLRVGEFRKMLRPNPPDLVLWVILVLCKPQLALLSNYVKDLGKVSAMNQMKKRREPNYLARLVHEISVSFF